MFLIPRKFISITTVLLLFAATMFAQQIVQPGESTQPTFSLPSSSSQTAADRFLVIFEEGVSPGQRITAVIQSGATPLHNLGASNAVAVILRNQNALNGLRNHPLVEAVVPDQIHFLHAKPAGPVLSLVGATDTTISLTWTPSAIAVNYELERCTGAGCGDFVQVATIAAPENNYVDPGLTPGTDYAYRMRFSQSRGPKSEYSNTLQATTTGGGGGAPNAPSGLMVTALSNTFVDLAWTDNSTTEDNFELARCEGSGCAPSGVHALLAANATAHTDGTVAAATLYRYTIRAVAGGSSSSDSNIVEVTTSADPTPPPPPPPCNALSGTRQIIPVGVQRAGLPDCVTDGTGIGIAIVDTGIDFTHTDLAPAPDLPGILNGDGTATGTSFNALAPGTSCQDLWSHGTHVAGRASALDNDEGVVGTAPGSTLCCVKVGATDAGEIFETDIFAGLNWIIAQHDQVNPPIKVVNISSGGDAGEDPLVDAEYQALITQLYNLGIVVVTSAGNDATAEISSKVPAQFPEVFSVAGTVGEDGIQICSDDLLALFGLPHLDPVLADTAAAFTTDGPGVTTSAEGEERSDGIETQSGCSFFLYGTLSTTLGGGATRKLPLPAGGFAEARGTSFAAPIIAGVAARIMQRDFASLTGTAADVEAVRAEIQTDADRAGTAPLDHPWGNILVSYSFDGVREGMGQAP